MSLVNLGLPMAKMSVGCLCLVIWGATCCSLLWEVAGFFQSFLLESLHPKPDTKQMKNEDYDPDAYLYFVDTFKTKSFRIDINNAKIQICFLNFDC